MPFLLHIIGSLSLSISNNPGAASDDLNTPETGDYGSLLGARYMCAETLEKEDSRYQETMQKACSIATAVPSSISVAGNSRLTQTFVAAYGFDLEEIQSDFTRGKIVTCLPFQDMYLMLVICQALWDNEYMYFSREYDCRWPAR